MLFSSCGYRPSSESASKIMGDKVSTQVLISSTEPENTVIIKDAIDQAVITKFRSSLVNKRYSDTHLKIVMNSISFSPLQYDVNGYVVTYRTIITLQILRESKNSSKTYTAKGTYDFAIESGATQISDQSRFEAIKFSSIKAIESFIAQVSAEGLIKH